MINHATSCDITSLAQRECDFKQSCYFNGTNILRDDAWANVEKNTTIRYTCSKIPGSLIFATEFIKSLNFLGTVLNSNIYNNFVTF